MFAVLYRFKVRSGYEADFKKNWASVTEEFRDDHGGLGSCLHLSDEGLFFAYARWPDRESWEREKDFKNLQAFSGMKNCIEERLAPIPLEVVNDLLVK